MLELVVIVAMAIGLALGIQAFLVKPYQIPSSSMVPTLKVGERVLVNRLSYGVGGEPSIGDIVVFNPPVSAEEGFPSDRCPAKQENEPCPESLGERSDDNFIKRVVAGPGDTFYVQDGHPVVNGEMAEEDFIRPCGAAAGCDLIDPIEIPADHYFMMGDNRGASLDSRFWGPVPEEWIIGKAFFTYWPPSEIGLF